MKKLSCIYQKTIKEFNLLWFIMVLGLGGTSIAGFAFLNYTLKRTPEMKGLVSLDLVNQVIPSMGGFYEFVATYLSVHIATFGILHLLALFLVTMFFIIWRVKSPEKFRDILHDPTRNATTIAPALAVGMTFNVFLSGGYFYFPFVRANMQDLMPIALGAWFMIWFYTMYMAIKIQFISLTEGFDLEKMHFGWLLIPFALAMTSVSGAGIAALAVDPIIAKVAFFFSLIPFTMALFLAIVKLLNLFRSHYESGLPSKIEFLPTFLIVVPIITLISISLFRFGHFFNHQFGHDMVPKFFFSMVTTGGWAFMTWYLILGMVMLKDYFKKYLFTMKYFDESQWGLICPMVAYAVLGSFVYKTMLPFTPILWVLVTFLVLDVAILTLMMYRQILKIRMCSIDND